MKKIWHDPVWSKVIASIIIGAVAYVFTFVVSYLRNRKSGESLSELTIEANAFVIVLLLAFLVIAIVAIAVINTLKKYDLFLSAPMSFETDDEYKKFRKFCLDLKQLLNECGFKRIYYAGEFIESQTDFSAHQQAAEEDLIALKASKRFLLVMPRKMTTSAVFEAGFAFRKGIPSVYFCKSAEDLPFLMKKLNESFKFVRLYASETGQLEGLLKYVKRHGRKIFSRKK